MAWYDVCGLAGVILVVAAYTLQQMGRLAGDSLSYQWLNAVGAAGVLVSLIYAFNLPAFVMESIWLVVSLYGMWRV